MRFFYITLLIVFFASCNSRGKTPDGIIAPKKMEALMWDMMQADALASDRISKDSTLIEKNERIKRYAQVLQIHGIDTAVFKKSMTFYLGHPDLHKIIFDSLNSRYSHVQEQKYKPVLKEVK